ncbi:filamentous hemagglutinin N-terminal domain-containing protein, partial [Helicobacter pullorum]|uniref:filamentous hemagglutinin N-terminal domain-containing protein n=1 Tax=Helicobacter pullorum TaxID=35818 RepID=UPI00117A23D1
VWGGGANKPLTNSLKTLKNSTPQKLTKNPKKIQESKKDSKTISKIGISIIASVLLSQNLAALPAGGKFIHGSGSISKNGNTMNITGNNRNHVIAWGGGFNISQGKTVNFNGSGKAFLNLDYSNKASKIRGTLNGGGNNIYLVNPSGVLIGEGGKVNNVGRFVASTSSLNEALNQFVNEAKQNGDQNAVNFSPVFTRGSLKGNVINMGTINANNITLVGTEVRNLTSNGTKDVQGKYNNGSGPNSLHIIGNKIFLDVEGVKNKQNIQLIGTNGIGQPDPQITVQMAMSTFKANGHKDWIEKNYSINGKDLGGGSWYVHNIITIGSEKGWNDFANAWNSNWGITRQIEEFKLISNLNFGNGTFESVGKPQGAGFNKIFNGNGYKMLNITLDNNDASNNNGTIVAGVFNKVGGGTIKNLTIDTINANITANSADVLHFGAFAGQINGGNINNVTVNNINIKGTIDYNSPNSGSNDMGYMGGFAGVINRGNISNVVLNNIEQVFVYSNQSIGATLYVGGFAGMIANANSSNTTINNAILNKIGTLRTDVVTGYGIGSANPLVAGFVPWLGSGNSISNASLYFTENSKLMPALLRDFNGDSRDKVHSFYHQMNGSSTIKNINIFYNSKATNPTYNRPDIDTGYGYVRDGNTSQSDRMYYTAKGLIEGIRSGYTGYYVTPETNGYYSSEVKFTAYDAVSNDMGFDGRVKAWYPNITVSNYNYSWVKQERISSTYPMNSSLNTKDDYTTLINTYLPQIIDDILEADYEVTIENDKGTSTQTALQDIMKRITNILNAINSKEGEG